MVVAFAPGVDAVGVPVNAVVSVRWNQPMNPNATFVVSGPSGVVEGEFAVHQQGLQVTFTPSVFLEPATRYDVLIANQRDAEGRVQKDPVHWSFQTVSPTSVSLTEFTAKPSARQAWWWTAWPWLMLLISTFSLIGFVRVWGRRSAYDLLRRNR